MRDLRTALHAIVVLCLIAPTLLVAQSGRWEVVDARPYNNTLSGVDMITPTTGIAVGERGVVRRTSDGGRSWSLQQIPAVSNLNDVAFVTTDIVVAVGSDGMIVRSADGGTTWSRIASPVTSPITAVDFADADRGIAVGAEGMILRSVDGGVTWSAIEAIGAGSINDVLFETDGSGLLVGEDGLIATSDDFGATWATTSHSSGAHLGHVARSDSRWFIAGDPWLFLYSDDRGVTWSSSVITPDAASYPRSQIALFGAFDDTTLTLAIDDRYVPMSIGFHTTDGGKSWEVRESESMGGFARAMSISGSSAVAVGRQNAYRSTNRGASWRSTASGVNTLYTAVEFADALYGVALAEENHLEFDTLGQIAGGPWTAVDVTTDGGKTWSSHRVFEGWNVRLKSAAYPDRSLVMAVGDSGLAVRSSDGGASWQRIDLGTNARLDNVSFSDPLHGTISGVRTLLRTEDGGLTWHRLDSLAPYHPLLATPSAERIIGSSYNTAAGHRLHLSTDGGESWSDHELHAGVMSIFFLDSLRGWTAGGQKSATTQGDQLNDLIHTTTDGGVTWTKQLDAAIGSPFGLWDIAFADANNGLAIGPSEKILRTRDGGSTWQQETFELTGAELYRSVAYPEPGLAFVVTGYGKMLRYTEAPTSRIVGGEESLDAIDMKLWPNPTRSALRVGFRLAARSEVDIRIIDLRGREVGPQIHRTLEIGEQSVDIDPGELAMGVYVVELAAEGKVVRKQLVVAR